MNDHFTDPELRSRYLVPIKGTTPLIVHNFSQKSKQAMLDIFQGKKAEKKPKNPKAEYLDSLYRIETKELPKVPLPGIQCVDNTKKTDTGFSTNGFKKSFVAAARFYKDLKMTELKQGIFIKGVTTTADPQSLVPIYGDHSMREDSVKVGAKQTDLRYRAEYLEWDAWLDITVVTSLVSGETALSFIDLVGQTVGVGEWRPERDGTFGTYRVSGQVCQVPLPKITHDMITVDSIEGK